MKNDYLNGTNYIVQQGTEMFHFGSDTELLGRFMDIHTSDSVLDIGTNNGALLLYAARRRPRKLTGIDLFEEVIQVAMNNCKQNQVEASFYVTPVQQFRGEKFDAIVCNPPYFNTSEIRLINENKYLKAARHEEFLTLTDLFESVHFLLKSNGRFFLVYRPQRLTEVLIEANKVGLTVVRMKVAYQSIHKNAKTILLEFRNALNPQVTIEAPAFLNDRMTFGWKGIGEV